MMYWYPFHKNFSSPETLLYLNDAAIISPLEFYLLLTLLSWFLRESLQRKLRFYQGPLFWPMMLFAAFIGFGLLSGIARGGNVNIALWETRTIFYLPLMAILVGNLFKKQAHIEVAIWAVMAALFVEGLVGTYTLLFILKGELSTVNAMTEHSAAIHLSTVFVFAAATLMFKVAWRKRLPLFIMAVPVLITIIGAKRRAAYVALLMAFVFLALVLYREHKRAFFFIIPLCAFLGLMYLGVFWNSNSPLGLGAQAVKSIVAEDQASERDQQSNLYRDIENFNSLFTIKQVPLTGIGFGNKYYIVIPLPDISFFEWWQYMPHNSVMYIWVKTGVGGFIGLLLMIGLSIMQGVRATIRVPGGIIKAITLTATLYIIMHFIFAYVDISWDAKSMVYVGLALGILNCVEHIVAIDPVVHKKRWPWQPELPEPVGLLPFSK